MKATLTFILLLLSFYLHCQDFDYIPKSDQPYGKLNPEAPKNVADYSELIGSSTCKSVSRVSQTEWADTVNMTWVFKYIMNGMAVQDETFKEDGIYSGSIRQYNADSSRWYVHYYSSGSVPSSFPVWEGNRDGNKIVLYKDQKAPNGFDGYYKIVFSNISNDSFDWTGAWVSKDESIVYPTWRIFCKKDQD